MAAHQLTLLPTSEPADLIDHGRVIFKFGGNLYRQLKIMEIQLKFDERVKQ